MKQSTWRYLIGIFLILVGASLFAIRLFDLPVLFTNLLFGGFMLLGGVLFLLPVLRTKVNWWALIPGLPLLLMGAASIISAFWPKYDDLIGVGFLVGIGLAFILTYLLHKHYWWALIPGVIMTGIGASTLVDFLLPKTNGNWISFIILGSIGLAFLFVYLNDRHNWWALIPFGVMVSVGVLVLTGMVGYLFLGMGLTFAMIPLLTGHENWWAWIPGGVLGLLGMSFLFFSPAAGIIGKFFLPIVLIGLGVLAIFQVVFPKNK